MHSSDGKQATTIVDGKKIVKVEKNLQVPFHMKKKLDNVQHYENEYHRVEKMSGHFKFELELSVKSHLDDDVFKDALQDAENTYVLQGLIVHEGVGTTESGHFVSYICPFYLNSWFKVDD